MGSPRHVPPHPRESLERCALRAQLRGDPALGSAFTASRMLLVEQPGPWGPAGLRESHFDSAVAADLESRAATEGIRVQVIRRPGRTPSGISRRWALVDTRDGHEAIRWGRFDVDAQLLDIPLDGSLGELDTEPVFLVCAHSKRDTCCALRGRPVAAAISEARPDRVWECSHLGGHRFAANVLVLPGGLLYGRVLPVAAAEFVAAADADDVLPELLRGRVGLQPAAQAALAVAYEDLAVRGRSELRVLSSLQIDDATQVVRIAGPDGRIEVTVRVDEVTVDGLSCAEPGPGTYLRYRPVLISRLGES